MGNIFDHTKVKLKFKSSCCTTVVDSGDESEDGGIDIQFKVEDSKDIHRERPQLQRQNGIIEEHVDEKRGTV